MFKIINDTVRNNCLNEIRSLPLGKYQVEIKEVKRSNRANAYYWMCLKIIADELGYEEEMLHYFFKKNFIGVEEKSSILGQKIEMPKSSKNLTKKEFTHFVNKVKILAATHDIILPETSYYGIE